MEFLGIGYQEVVLILVVTLVFVGPERLPHVAFQIGRAVRELRRYANAVREEFSEEFEYLEEQYRTVRGEVDSMRDAVRTESASLRAPLQEIAGPAAEPPPAPEPIATNGASDGASSGIPANGAGESSGPEREPLLF